MRWGVKPFTNLLLMVSQAFLRRKFEFKSCGFMVVTSGSITRRGAAYEARLALLFRSPQTGDVTALFAMD